MDCSPPKLLLSLGFPRQEYCSGLPFPSPGDLPDPEIQHASPAWLADSLLWSHLKAMADLISAKFVNHLSSGSWWWTGKPGVLQSMGLQRVRNDWGTELNWTVLPWGKHQKPQTEEYAMKYLTSIPYNYQSYQKQRKSDSHYSPRKPKETW